MVESGTTVILEPNVIREGDNGSQLTIKIFGVDNRIDETVKGTHKVRFTSENKSVSILVDFENGEGTFTPNKNLTLGRYDVTVNVTKTVRGKNKTTIYPSFDATTLSVKGINVPMDNNSSEQPDVNLELDDLRNRISAIISNQNTLQDNLTMIYMLVLPVYSMLSKHDNFKDVLGGADNPHIFKTKDGKTTLNISDFYSEGMAEQSVKFSRLDDGLSLTEGLDNGIS